MCYIRCTLDILSDQYMTVRVVHVVTGFQASERRRFNIAEHPREARDRLNLHAMTERAARSNTHTRGLRAHKGNEGRSNRSLYEPKESMRRHYVRGGATPWLRV